jgi:hypothetical protein
MSEPTPRQVLYALVAAGFLVVVGILIIGAAVGSLVPLWWTVVMLGLLIVTAAWSVLHWRRTVPLLLLSIVLFGLWTVGTLILY